MFFKSAGSLTQEEMKMGAQQQCYQLAELLGQLKRFQEENDLWVYRRRPPINEDYQEEVTTEATHILAAIGELLARDATGPLVQLLNGPNQRFSIRQMAQIIAYLEQIITLE